MSNCYLHDDFPSVGTCVSCGKFICANCNTELKNKNYCKKCVDELFNENKKKIENLESNKNSQQPMVFMNAGGGGGASSAASSSNGGADLPHAFYSKSKTTAGVLAILLGGLGIHKFYLGKWIQGIIYLLLCWTYIPSVIALIEGIVYLVSDKDTFAKKHDKRYRISA